MGGAGEEEGHAPPSNIGNLVIVRNVSFSENFAYVLN